MAMTSGHVATKTNGSAPRPEREPWSSPGSGERSRIGVMLVHGFTGSPVSLRPLGELLAKRGFSVEIPRLPGHGTTWREMIPTRYEDWRAEVVRKANELRSRTERLVLVGLSMGGTLSLDVSSSGEV